MLLLDSLLCGQFHTFHGHNEKKDGDPCRFCGENAGSPSTMTNGDLCSDTPPANVEGAVAVGPLCITVETSGGKLCGTVRVDNDRSKNGYGNIMSYVSILRVHGGVTVFHRVALQLLRRTMLVERRQTK